MAYSDSFPTQRPIFTLDAANAGRLDPRISYSRSTTGTYFGTAKHESSQNLITNSEDFSAWTASNTTPTANAIAAPDGTTTADTITGTGTGSLQKTVQSNTIANVSYPVVSVYVKAGTHNFIQIQSNWSGSHYANFDVTSGAGAVGSLGGNTTATIQAVGSTGWYRCVCRYNAASMTPVIIIRLVDSGSAAYGASTTSTGTVHLWGAMATDIGDLTNIVAYQPSTTQIHREYAPTLQTAAINAPRFEYSASDSASEAIGSSRGLLIEGQAQNLIARSDSIDNAYWTKSNCTVTAAAAVGVTGALNACLITESEEVSPATAAHEFYSSIFGLSSATGCTVSLYCKSTGVPRLRLLSTIGGSTRNVIFDIANGTVVSEASATGAVESVGNGFYRISMTYTPTATTNGRLYLTFLDASNNVFYTGNGYNGVITSGFQFEMNSFASSFVSSDSGSATTRASDSASAVTADIGYTGGPVSVVVEANMQSPAANSNNRAVLELVKSGSTANRLLLYNYPGRADGVYAVADGVGTAALSGSISTDDYFKIGVSMDTNSIARSVNGGAITEDTSGQLPSDLNTLSIGCGAAGVVPIDGHIKRVALYSEALSDSNLISLTK